MVIPPANDLGKFPKEVGMMPEGISVEKFSAPEESSETGKWLFHQSDWEMVVPPVKVDKREFL